MRWLGRRRIFDARRLAGKRDWLINYTPFYFLGHERVNALYFLETFPGGSEWAEYIPGCPMAGPPAASYLYYRLHGTPGEVALSGPEGAEDSRKRVTMQNYDTSYHVSGGNQVVGGFALAEVHRVHDTSCDPWLVANPTCIRQPPTFGLYALAKRSSTARRTARPSAPSAG